LTIRELFPEEAGNFAAINIPRSVTPIAIMLAEKYPRAKELAKKYRKGLRIITENGTYQEILEKYYGRDRIPVNWFSNLARFADMYDIKEGSR
jgi:ABC-type amino acid transport substrate-binding protein